MSVADDAVLVEAANAELYEAFEVGDLDRMESVWDEGDVVCVHPGWPMLHGRERVLRSWAMIMANTDYIQFFLTDVVVAFAGEVAVVTCEENILTELEDVAGNVRIAATNVFRRRDGQWRLWLHHGSPVLAPPSEAPEELP
ncbi:MAG: nuclear transport factor 2 family protein [Actinomycetota bacterium]|nr:nuclear transport factor 2 family protein [Actinomycetota bacterium]